MKARISATRVPRQRLDWLTTLHSVSTAAFTGGANPYACDHAELEEHHRVHLLPERFLLQVVHGANLSNRRPRWLRFYRRVALDRLRPFGLDPEIW